MIADHHHRSDHGNLLDSDHYTSMLSMKNNGDDDTDTYVNRNSNSSLNGYLERSSGVSEDTYIPQSPYAMSPWHHSSPFARSPWMNEYSDGTTRNGFVGVMVREEGHVYSLAISGDLLYTGSDSKNIRVWRNMKEFAGFKSSSGLVKAIVICGERIFTGHQDGKIRIWRISPKNPGKHDHIGSLPTTKDFIKSSVNPKNYLEVKRHRNALRIKHSDVVSCMSLNEEYGLLYTGSWDRTMKIWRIANSKCLESITAHDDALNSVVSGFDSLVFTGSADGTVKVWHREVNGEGTRHFLVRILLKQETAVTALAVSSLAVIYCGSSEGLVMYWEREKQLSEGGVLRGHKVAVLCLATAVNLVFSGSADKNICVWKRDVDGAHRCLSVLTGHTGPVKCLAVKEVHEGEFPDEKGGEKLWVVFSGSLDKSVKVWRVSEKPPELNRNKDSEWQRLNTRCRSNRFFNDGE